MTIRKRGGEIVVPQGEPRSEYGAFVTALSGGRALLVWQDAGLRGETGRTRSDIHARILDRDGNPVGDEFTVSQLRDDQNEAHAAGLAGGGFVVVWRAFHPLPDFGGQYQTVQAQFYDANAAPIGRAIAIDGSPSGYGEEPQVVGLADGSALIVWTDAGATTADATDVHMRHFSATGERLGRDQLVSTETAGYQLYTAVTATADGGYAIAWIDAPRSLGDDTGASLQFQRFDAAGVRIGDAVTVRSGIPSFANPSLAALADGTFALAYSVYNVGTWPDGSEMNAFVQHLSAGGQPIGAPDAVSPATAGHQLATSVVARDGGGYLFAWTDFVGDADGAAVRAQAFDAAGHPEGKVLTINTDTVGGQFVASLANLGNGRLIAAWTDETPLGDGWNDYDARAQALVDRPRLGAIDPTAFGADRHAALHDMGEGALGPARWMVDHVALA